MKRPRRHDDVGRSTVERVRLVIAGRGRPPSTVPGDRTPDARLPADAPGDLARPPFARPVTGPVATPPDVEVVVGRPAPTSAVSRARPNLPSGRDRSTMRALVTWGGVVTVVVAVVLAMVVIGRGHAPAVAARAPTGHAPAVPRPSPSTPPTVTAAKHSTSTSTADSAPHDPASSTTGHDRANWAAVLRRLDDLRSRAYATRNANLLRRVYASGRLRSSDAAAIARLVPAGCGLRGVRTTFDAVDAQRRRGVTRVTARASLPASHLVCSGRVVRTEPAVAPTRLAVTLVDRGGTTLIAAERVLP